MCVSCGVSCGVCLCVCVSAGVSVCGCVDGGFKQTWSDSADLTPVVG